MEKVVDERHKKGASQRTLEAVTRTKEEREQVFDYIADFFYENGIPFNAANSRSYEYMIEAVGRFGPGLKPPSSYELRVPLLEKAKKKTDEIKKSMKMLGRNTAVLSCRTPGQTKEEGI